jgi:accessory Sec system glycosylation protein GtfA
MTIYHINKGIGMSSSGIEYAQKYRYDLVKDFPERQVFVFCDYIYANYTRFTDNIGIDSAYTLNAYKYMAHQENHPSSCHVEDFAQMTAGFTRTDDGERAVDFTRGPVKYKFWLITDDTAKGCLDRIDIIVANRLQEVHHYSDRLTSIDYYGGKEIIARYFYDESGKLSMRQFLKAGKLSFTLVDGLVLHGAHAFYDAFFKRLAFGSDDIVVLDRNTDLNAIFLNKNDSKFVVVVHAEHFSKHLTDETWTLWNNYYEYVFVNHKLIDAYVTSTDKQTERLRHQFRTAGNPNSRIVTIPVGTVPELASGTQVTTNKNKFLTASRLAAEKHIDILVKAVVEAKKQLPDLEFHIYGEGGNRKMLTDLITTLNAGDYIIMEGHKHLSQEYGKYGGYLTASGSEGFGLTILEAVSSCLPLIGLDVDYGNTTFITEGVNGYKLPRGTEDEQVASFANAITKLVQTLDYDAAIAESKRLATPYLSDNVRKKWRTFFEEVHAQKGVAQ